MTGLLSKVPWFVSAPLVVAAAGLFGALSYMFAGDLFYETCANERNLLTGEFEPSNCGEGAKVAGAQQQGGGGTPNAPGGAVVASGSFRDGDATHDGSGSVELQRLPGGKLNLLLKDFSVTNGPDLFVVLSVSDGGDYSSRDVVLQPGLKANNGTQNYDIPEGTDVTRFKSVIIWCRQFDVTFAYAPLEVQ
jgi:Electron transfer DM13